MKLGNLVQDQWVEGSGDGRLLTSAVTGEPVATLSSEGLDFKALHTKFRRQKTVILGVSRDSIASHEKFKAKQGFPFDLLSDPDEKLCKQFDVIHEKSLYGKKFLGVVRSTFLIDKDGKLREEWRKVKVKGHAEEVLERVRMLNAG